MSLRNALVMVVDLESQGNKVGMTIGLVDHSLWSSATPVIIAARHKSPGHVLVLPGFPIHEVRYWSTSLF